MPPLLLFEFKTIRKKSKTNTKLFYKLPIRIYVYFNVIDTVKYS